MPERLRTKFFEHDRVTWIVTLVNTIRQLIALYEHKVVVGLLMIPASASRWISWRRIISPGAIRGPANATDAAKARVMSERKRIAGW